MIFTHNIKTQIYLPVVYALNTFGLCFACIPSLFVWLLLEKREEMKAVFKTSTIAKFLGKCTTEVENPQALYKPVPMWWYLVTTLLAIGVGIFACEFYPVQLHWYGVLLALVVSAAFFIPVCFRIVSLTDVP